MALSDPYKTIRMRTCKYVCCKDRRIMLRDLDVMRLAITGWERNERLTEKSSITARRILASLGKDDAESAKGEADARK